MAKNKPTHNKHQEESISPYSARKQKMLKVTAWVGITAMLLTTAITMGSSIF